MFSPSLPGAFFVLVIVVVLVLDPSRFTPFFEYEDEDRFAEDEDDLIPSLLLSCFSSPQNVADQAALLAVACIRLVVLPFCCF